jgi:hypothetical protein
VRGTPFSTEAGEEGETSKIIVAMLEGEPDRATVPVLEEEETWHTVEALVPIHIYHMLSSKLELGFENLETTGRIGAEEEAGWPSTVMAVIDDAKMEDLVGEEAPAISMDLEWYKCSKKRAMVDLDLVVRVPHLNIVAKFRRK